MVQSDSLDETMVRIVGVAVSESEVRELNRSAAKSWVRRCCATQPSTPTRAATPGRNARAARSVTGITISTVRPLRGVLLRMAISLLAIVVIWLLVLVQLHDAISS